MAKYTRAKFLSDPSVKTPVFPRFSTVVGPRGLPDTFKGAVGLGESTGLGGFAERFLESLAQHRHWGREQSAMIPA